MTKIVEYRVIPHHRWMVVRFESESSERGGSTQRGEFSNEREANEVAQLLAKAEGASFVSNSVRGAGIGALAGSALRL
jgi:hypothetical protein